MTVVLTILAVARVTRLITTDKLTEAPRNALVLWLIDRRGEGTRLAYLVMCDWCMSVYTGSVAACAYAVWHDTLAYMAVTLALSASYVTGFLASATETGE